MLEGADYDYNPDNHPAEDEDEEEFEVDALEEQDINEDILEIELEQEEFDGQDYDPANDNMDVDEPDEPDDPRSNV
jgi:hypothetical protein